MTSDEPSGLFYCWTWLLPELRQRCRATSMTPATQLMLGMTSREEQDAWTRKVERYSPIREVLIMEGLHRLALIGRVVIEYTAKGGTSSWKRLLHSAIANGHEATVEWLCAMCPYYSSVPPDSEDAIVTAIDHGRWRIFEILVGKRIRWPRALLRRCMRRTEKLASYLYVYFDKPYMLSRYKDYLQQTSAQCPVVWDAWSNVVTSKYGNDAWVKERQTEFQGHVERWRAQRFFVVGMDPTYSFSTSAFSSSAAKRQGLFYWWTKLPHPLRCRIRVAMTAATQLLLAMTCKEERTKLPRPADQYPHVIDALVMEGSYTPIERMPLRIIEPFDNAERRARNWPHWICLFHTATANGHIGAVEWLLAQAELSISPPPRSDGTHLLRREEVKHSFDIMGLIADCIHVAIDYGQWPMFERLVAHQLDRELKRSPTSTLLDAIPAAQHLFVYFDVPHRLARYEDYTRWWSTPKKWDQWCQHVRANDVSAKGRFKTMFLREVRDSKI